jgi:hypothetical protein
MITNDFTSNAYIRRPNKEVFIALFPKKIMSDRTYFVEIILQWSFSCLVL